MKSTHAARSSSRGPVARLVHERVLLQHLYHVRRVTPPERPSVIKVRPVLQPPANDARRSTAGFPRSAAARWLPLGTGLQSPRTPGLDRGTPRPCQYPPPSREG